MTVPVEAVDSRPAALRAWLKGGQAWCPCCGHGLRGLDVTVCPECGNALRLEVMAGPERMVVPARLLLWTAVLGSVIHSINWLLPFAATARPHGTSSRLEQLEEMIRDQPTTLLP